MNIKDSYIHLGPGGNNKKALLKDFTITANSITLTRAKLVLNNGVEEDETDLPISIPTWNLNTTGNAATATNADKLDGFHRDFFPGELIISTNSAAETDWKGVSQLPSANDFTSGYRFLYWRVYNYGSGNQTMTLTFQDGSTKTFNLYYSGATRLTSHISGTGRYVSFVYLENASVGGTLYTGAWMVLGYFTDTTYIVNSYYELRFIHSNETPLYRYKLCGYDKLGKVVPLTITNQTNSTIVDKTPVTVPMEVSRGIVLYNTTEAIESSSTSFTTLCNEIATTYPVYTFNTNLPAFSDVFLVGSYNKFTDEFTLDTTSHTSWYICANRNTTGSTYTENFVSGKYYWYVGPTKNATNYLQLKLLNICYYFDGTNLIEVHSLVVQHKLTSTAIGSTNSPLYWDGTEFKECTALENKYVNISGDTMTGALTVPSLSVTGAATFSQAINGSILGNAATASRLQNARTISLTGTVTGSGTFDGSGNLSIAVNPKIRISGIASSSNTNNGIYYYNGTTDYLLIGQCSSHLWIGSNETAGTHHPGSTYISAGAGDAYISRLVSGTRTNYKILDAGNGVDLATALTITGIKTFSGGLKLNTGSSWTNAERAIPFSDSSDLSLLKYYHSGFTYNPTTNTFNNNGCRQQYDSTNKVLKFIFD